MRQPHPAQKHRSSRQLLLGILLGALAQSSSAVEAMRQIKGGENIPQATGFVAEDPQHYQAMPRVARFRAYLPPVVDLSPYFPKVRSQGAQGSCTAWATGYATRSYYLARYQQANLEDESNLTSPAFIFNALRQGNCQQGTRISDALKLLQQNGAVPLSQHPYDPKDCSRLPAPEAVNYYRDKFKILGFERLNVESPDDIKGQLYQGNPVIFGMTVPKAFDTYDGGVLDIPERSPSDSGGHAMVIVGYDDAKQAFRLFNSWGTRWGEQGYAWVSYRMLKTFWQNGFVMKVAANSRPPRPPQPPTPPVNTPLPTFKIDLTCGRLQGQVRRNGEAYQVNLQGIANTADEVRQVSEALRQQGRNIVVDSSEVQIRPWPQCEALLTFAEASQQKRGLNLRIEGDKNRLRAGETLVLEVQSPDFPSYLYLAYIQADGSAVHLLHPSLGATPANSVLRFGASPNQPRLKIRPPFGAEMFLLVASPKPLLDAGILGEQTERQLLSAYRQALLNPANKGVVASILMLETTE